MSCVWGSFWQVLHCTQLPGWSVPQKQSSLSIHSDVRRARDLHVFPALHVFHPSRPHLGMLNVPQSLCSLASADEGKAAWLHTAGVLRLLERLTLLRAELDQEPGPPDGAPASPDGLSLRVKKQARSLCLAGFRYRFSGLTRRLRRVCGRSAARLSVDIGLVSLHGARGLLAQPALAAQRCAVPGHLDPQRDPLRQIACHL